MVFSCFLVISEINSAEWTGLAVIILSYLYVIGNAIMIFFEARKRINSTENDGFSEDNDFS